jgi:hypothetical protein
MLLPHLPTVATILRTHNLEALLATIILAWEHSCCIC